MKIQTNNFKDENFFDFILRESGENLCLFVLKFSFFSAFASIGDSVDIYDYSKDFHLSLKSLLLCAADEKLFLRLGFK